MSQTVKMVEEFEYAGRRLRPIPDFSGYYAGDDGSLWSKWGIGYKPVLTNKLRRLHGCVNLGGYLVIYVKCDKKGLMAYVHSLVLSAFSGVRPSGLQCRHLNGDKLDNRLVNLQWGTAVENAKDTIRHGAQLRGEQIHQSKLTAKQVRAIRKKYASGTDSSRELSIKYGVHQRTIRTIVSRKTWKHVK